MGLNFEVIHLNRFHFVCLLQNIAFFFSLKCVISHTRISFRSYLEGISGVFVVVNFHKKQTNKTEPSNEQKQGQRFILFILVYIFIEQLITILFFFIIFASNFQVFAVKDVLDNFDGHMGWSKIVLLQYYYYSCYMYVGRQFSQFLFQYWWRLKLMNTTLNIPKNHH